MRGEDSPAAGFFSDVRLEQRIAADHPLRAIRELVDAPLKELSPAFDKILRARGPAIDPARAAAAGAFAAGLLHDALGTPVDGATRLQSLVPLVRRPVDRQCGVGCHRLVQEPRSGHVVNHHEIRPQGRVFQQPANAGFLQIDSFAVIARRAQPAEAIPPARSPRPLPRLAMTATARGTSTPEIILP